MPESPRWLLYKGRKEEAKASLVRCRGGVKLTATDIDTELGQLSREAQETASFFTRALLPNLVLGGTLIVIMQLTGQVTVLFFAPEIFGLAGFKSAAALATVGLGLVKFVCTIIALAVIDKIGRRRMIFLGSVGTTVSIVGMAVAMSLSHESKLRAALSLTFTLSFIACWALSWGCVAWVYPSEIFPVNVRGTALGFTQVLNHGTNAIVATAFLSLLDSVGAVALFLGFAVFNVAGIAFAHFVMIETKGKTFDEVNAAISSHPLLGKILVQSYQPM
jgi:MFS family permease